MDGMLKQQQYQQKGSNRFLSSFKFLYLRINGQRFSFPSTIFSCSQSWSFHHFLPPSRMIKRRLAFLPGWTADWCQCQGGGCRVIFGRSGKIRHIDLKSTGNLRGFLIFSYVRCFKALRMTLIAEVTWVHQNWSNRLVLLSVPIAFWEQ